MMILRLFTTLTEMMNMGFMEYLLQIITRSGIKNDFKEAYTNIIVYIVYIPGISVCNSSPLVYTKIRNKFP